MRDYAELVKALRDSESCNAWDAADAIEELLKQRESFYHLVHDMNLNEIVYRIHRDSLHSWLKSWQSAADVIYNHKPPKEME